MDIPIQQPVLSRIPGNLMESLDPCSNGANTFLAGSLVKRDASSLLAACVTADSSALGWCPGPSQTPGEKRPDVFYDPLAFPVSDPASVKGPYPARINGAELILSVTDGSGHVGEANGAPQQSEIVIGATYGLYRWTTGDYNQMQAANVDDTAASGKLLTAVGFVLDSSSTDYNPRVRFRIADARIQI